jgi:hypothetical protein
LSPLSPSSPYALKVMTIAAVVLFPVVLAYQAWTYYTFGHRIGGTSPSPHPPASLRSWPKDDPFPVMALACWRRCALGRRSTVSAWPFHPTRMMYAA